ncbi:MAG: putative lipid II flippase FtsW [Candidatus Pacebacteria bacterium]|nr:putative lipid II flippase FtsW [Candidatus Paceibacterota bacterium]
MPKIHKKTSLRHKSKPDVFLLVVFLILLVWGLFTVGTTSFSLSLERYNNVWYLFLHQLVMAAIGIMLGIIAYKLPLKYLQKIAPFLFLISIILIFLVFVPKLGIESKGAHRWLNIFGLSFQPSEFLKVSFIIYLAAWLSSRSQKEKKQKESKAFLLPFFVILAVLFVGLIKQPDMTTLFIICVVGTIMYFSSSAPWWHTGILGGLGGALFLIYARLEPYRWNRIINLFNPHADPMGKGFQVKQAAIAIGSGKAFGVGQGFSLGLSRQKFGFLPESVTDSIFAIIAEELGLLGAMSLIILFLLFCWQGLKIAKHSGQTFEGFLALGITGWITLQAFANIGGITGILPLGGVPLPFFSYGGSHIMAELVGIGLLLNISKR